MIEVAAEPWEAIIRHAERSYPEECCGALLGRVRDGRKSVLEAVALDNVSTGERRQRYELRPEDLLAAEKTARHRGLDLVGIFHSHPDCDAYFSETDLRNSCPWYSFVVLSVKSGKFDHANSFLPDLEQTRADREELIWQKS